STTARALAELGVRSVVVASSTDAGGLRAAVRDALPEDDARGQEQLARALPMSRSHSETAFRRASTVSPGGVHSPVRAFRAVGGTPIFFARGEGAHFVDVDGN